MINYPKNKALFFTAFVLIIIIALIFFASLKQYSELCIKSKCFNVKIAQTDPERARGLMFEKNLPENEGLLFILDNRENSSFWMKNMLIPLDIIWIDENNSIASINKNNPPCNETCTSIIYEKKAKYALEINAGVSDKYNFSVGDAVELN
jgi:hypothetical protein